MYTIRAFGPGPYNNINNGYQTISSEKYIEENKFPLLPILPLKPPKSRNFELIRFSIALKETKETYSTESLKVHLVKHKLVCRIMNQI